LPQTFSVSAKADGGEFVDGDSAALAWDVLRRTADHQTADVIDLSHCPHLKPYAIACLCGLAELARADRRPTRIVPPIDAGCAAHLARLGVPAFFEPEGWGAEPAWGTNVAVRRVTWPPGNEGERIVEVLSSRAELPAGVFPNMVELLDEIIRNALTHAESPIECIVAGQAFPHTQKVEVAVLDLGQTILGHLTKNPRHAGVRTHREAIFRALEDGVTGTPDGQRNRRGEQNSGAGLSALRAYCESGGGELTVLSGDVWVTSSQTRPPVIGTLYRPFRGCLVNIRYFTHGNLTPLDVEPIL